MYVDALIYWLFGTLAVILDKCTQDVTSAVSQHLAAVLVIAVSLGGTMSIPVMCLLLSRLDLLPRYTASHSAQGRPPNAALSHDSLPSPRRPSYTKLCRTKRHDGGSSPKKVISPLAVVRRPPLSPDTAREAMLRRMILRQEQRLAEQENRIEELHLTVLRTLEVVGSTVHSLQYLEGQSPPLTPFPALPSYE